MTLNACRMELGPKAVRPPLRPHCTCLSTIVTGQHGSARGAHPLNSDLSRTRRAGVEAVTPKPGCTGTQARGAPSTVLSGFHCVARPRAPALSSGDRPAGCVPCSRGYHLSPVSQCAVRFLTVPAIGTSLYSLRVTGITRDSSNGAPGPSEGFCAHSFQCVF